MTDSVLSRVLDAAETHTTEYIERLQALADVDHADRLFERLRCAVALDAVRVQEALLTARLEARLAAAEAQLSTQEAAVRRIESSYRLPLYTATVALTGPVASADGAAALVPAASALATFDAQAGGQLAAAAGRLADEVSAVVTATAPVRA
jgi:hypothetical protein